MTISRVKPATWGSGEKLTSAQMNGVDVNTTYALDKRAANTDTIESIFDDSSPHSFQKTGLWSATSPGR
jgi:hypothetical protein